MEKKIGKLEHRIEASHEDLRTEIKELKERQRHNKWTIGGLIACMDGMEARMAFLQAQVAALIPTPAMDLSREENEGIVGDLMMMGPSEGIGSPSSLLLNKAQLDALGALARNWEFLNQEESGISGDYTPTGPHGQNPEV